MCDTLCAAAVGLPSPSSRPCCASNSSARRKSEVEWYTISWISPGLSQGDNASVSSASYSAGEKIGCFGFGNLRLPCCDGSQRYLSVTPPSLRAFLVGGSQHRLSWNTERRFESVNERVLFPGSDACLARRTTLGRRPRLLKQFPDD